MCDDNFARQFQYIVYNHDVRFDASGLLVAFPGEDTVHDVTARLRPFAEPFWEMRDFYAEPSDQVLLQVKALFNTCGYSLHEQKFDF